MSLSWFTVPGSFPACIPSYLFVPVYVSFPVFFLCLFRCFIHFCFWLLLSMFIYMWICSSLFAVPVPVPVPDLLGTFEHFVGFWIPFHPTLGFLSLPDQPAQFEEDKVLKISFCLIFII